MRVFDRSVAGLVVMLAMGLLLSGCMRGGDPVSPNLSEIELETLAESIYRDLDEVGITYDAGWSVSESTITIEVLDTDWERAEVVLGEAKQAWQEEDPREWPVDAYPIAADDMSKPAA